MRTAFASGWLLGGFVALLAPVLASASPRLVVLVAVDQLRRDRIDDTLPGGLGRLVREGHVFTEGVVDHAASETCPGHASISSGRHPGRVGVVANRYIEVATGERRYCVWDPSPDAAVIGAEDPEDGRSPRALRTDALGDWMKRADPAARVFAVSAKDRSAITLGGQGPDGVYWLRRNARPGFTTSLHYARELPGWVARWNDDLVERVPAEWIHEPPPGLATAGRPDDFPGESDERSRTSPHPVHQWQVTVEARLPVHVHE